MSDNPRTYRVTVVLTEEEKRKIDAAAKEAGVGASTYMRIKTLEAI